MRRILVGVLLAFFLSVAGSAAFAGDVLPGGESVIEPLGDVLPGGE